VGESLAAQARQLQVLSSCCPQAPFPPVLEATPERILLRYVPGTTLRDSRDVLGDAARHELLATAVGTVFHLAGCWPDRLAGHGAAPAGRGFLAAELRRRLHRLDTAIRELRRGPQLRGALARCDGGALLRGLSQADRSGELERIDSELSPARLGLGIHGDLTPQNVICDPAAGRGLTLIDPRGMVRWQEDLPWWDPVFDLAAAVVFDGAIDPIAAAEDGELDRPDLPGALAASLAETRTALVAGCAADPQANAWIGKDPHWLRRLDFAILARLLGNIAVQAEHGGPSGVSRAAAVYAVSRLWYHRIQPTPGSHAQAHGSQAQSGQAQGSQVQSGQLHGGRDHDGQAR
jgi:hypothetical protein